MNIYQPLAAFPQFLVLEFPGFKEYRVENWHVARDGSGRVVHPTSGLTWKETFHAFALSYFWPKATGSIATTILVTIYYIWLVYSKCTQVLHESVIVMPAHGIQLETHRGLPPLRLAVSRQFIPLSALQDVIINEGLSGWDVRFYLAILRRLSDDEHILKPCFSSILPYFPIVLYIYNGIHDTLDPK